MDVKKSRNEEAKGEAAQEIESVEEEEEIGADQEEGKEGGRCFCCCCCNFAQIQKVLEKNHLPLRKLRP